LLRGEPVYERPFTMENRVGRLIEARVFALRTREEADAYSQELGVTVMRAPLNTRPVLCADHRPVAVYSQPVADRLVQLFTQMNTRLERVAILAQRTNATLVLQLERIVREAANSGRRVCYSSEEAQEHLAPVLDARELGVMRDFLAAGPATMSRR
jgi:hypothetical protein